ncbi:MAG TPA: ribosomal protein S18-alanine N-acetyltransferase [Mycobacteriales bacterium]|nr:ribosomal protein S18-alanine N-acetyltransferase [Mycobacteriales bacterium]
MRWWDIAAVVPLERDLFRDDTWSERVFWSELAQVRTRHYVVASEHAGTAAGAGPDGTVVGYAGLAVYADEAHVLTLGVRADRQNGGVGGSLLRDLLGAADRRGARRVLLEVRAGNLPAERLYARYGFAPIGIRKRYYQPSGADAVVMVREG